MLRKYRALISSQNIGILFFVLTIAASVQKYFLQGINNYLIFSRSFEVLISHQNLYVKYPALYNDKFLYSPTFALCAGLFYFLPDLAYFLPDLAGVVLWNLLNFTLFFYAVKTISGDEKKFILIFAVASVELFNSIQNNQSNPLVTALILFAFASFEKRKISSAALFVASLFFIKIYGIAAAVFALLHSEKFKFAKWLIFWFVLLFALPLILVSFQELVWQYESWFEVIKNFKTGTQLSVMGVTERWSGLQIYYLPAQIAGLLILLAPFVYFRRFSDAVFRRKLLCSLLIFLVIFNQSAESPTYITAVTGAAIWFADSRKNIADYILIFLVLVFTSLGSTSVFPSAWRHNFFEAYGLKVVPCFLVWLKIQYELHTFDSGRQKPEDRS
ncbi:MAG: glycosyltransferase family 87 protein [Pyrinomonadaceae bacterium]